MAETDITRIEEVINGLLDNYRLVFWYDEGGTMRMMAESMQLKGAEVLILQDNPFSLKHRILKGEQPERGFVVYSPKSQPDDEENWLLDLQVSGVLFSADHGALYAAECNIPLELKAKVVDAHLEFFKNSTNRQKLKALLKPGMDQPQMERMMLKVVTKTEPVCDQITYALAQELLDNKQTIQSQLEKCNLSDIFWNDVEQTFGYNEGRQVKDLLAMLFNDDLQQHITGAKLTNEAHIFMRDWRDSRQNGELYKAWAIRLEDELNVRQIVEDCTMEQLVKIVTFPCIDKFITAHLQVEVMNSTMTSEQIADIVDEREHKLFFSTAGNTMKALLEARRLTEEVEQQMSGLIINTPEEGIRLYEQSLYLIDFYYRRYFRHAKSAEGRMLLESVTEMVQRTYTNSFLNVLAQKWQPLVDNMEKWQITNYLSQRFFFQYRVAPYTDKNRKLFVIISDGLRYETMIELQQLIAGISRMEAKMQPPLIATQPAYTKLGMAALLPHQQLSYNKDADEVFADDLSTNSTEGRGKVLKKKVPRSLAITAENFLSIASPKTYFRDFDLIYIYSNVIDHTGDDKLTESQVFEKTDDEFKNIIKIVEKIRNGNGSNVLITSDHGYLYQNEKLDPSEFTDFEVMGDVIADSRRFIVGNNLQPGDAVKTWNSEQVGLRTGRQIQTAKGLIRLLKNGSGSRYVHGGSMPQEIVVPVLHVNIGHDKDISQTDVDILNKRSRITTNNQTISFYQTEAVTEKVKGVTLRMGFYDNKGELISDAVTMVFDSQSSDSVEREQKHQFVFKNQLTKLNGQEIILRIERQLSGGTTFSRYKEIPYKVSVMFQAEF